MEGGEPSLLDVPEDVRRPKVTVTLGEWCFHVHQSRESGSIRKIQVKAELHAGYIGLQGSWFLWGGPGGGRWVLISCVDSSAFLALVGSNTKRVDHVQHMRKF